MKDKLLVKKSVLEEQLKVLKQRYIDECDISGVGSAIEKVVKGIQLAGEIGIIEGKIELLEELLTEEE